MDTVIYDLSWDEGPDYQGVYAKGLLVEAMERIVNSLCEEDYATVGKPTGTYVLADHHLPVGYGVLLKGHANPIFGEEAEKAWNLRVVSLTDFESL